MKRFLCVIWFVCAGITLGSAASAETGDTRVSVLDLSFSNGGTGTNTFSYNAEGQRTRNDIAIQIDANFSVTTAVEYGYDANGRLETRAVTSQTSAGTHVEESVYNYDANTPNILRSIEGSDSSGTSYSKEIEYEDNGRVSGMRFSATTPGGAVSVNHTLVFDDMGRVIGNRSNQTSSAGTATGFYDIIYDEQGKPASYIKQTPSEDAPTNGEFFYVADTVAIRETAQAFGETMVTDIAYTYETGLCKVSQLSDALVIEAIFDGPGAPAGILCRDE